MTYLINNNCTKNYRNPTTVVKDIVEGWVVYVYFSATQCMKEQRLQNNGCEYQYQVEPLFHLPTRLFVHDI